MKQTRPRAQLFHYTTLIKKFSCHKMVPKIERLILQVLGEVAISLGLYSK